MEALKHAYDKMARPTTLVLLHDNKDQFWKAKDTLTHEGLSVVTYKDPDDAQNACTFLWDGGSQRHLGDLWKS